MIKTYVYGVPHGFDFYEKDVELNAYFKGFYISSRRGRRLMINRRENGETIYSYLHYGLKEVDRQPLHSFFGMSLVVDNYQFCPNFKVLLEWFDYLFNKLVNEHNIIKRNDDGVLYYVIHKFEENSSDVEWIKNNLPNILKSEQAQIINYDNTYVDGKAGQVVSINQTVGENRLLETFKNYRWLSITSEIVEKQDPIVGDSFQIELDFNELDGKLNEYSQYLLPIAIDISKGSKEDLLRREKEVYEISNSLTKYLPTIDDTDEKVRFKELEDKYDSLHNNIVAVLDKFSSLAPKLKPSETQFCYSCKQNKPISHFRSNEATKCIECEERDRQRISSLNSYKTCTSCGKRKPIRFFSQPDEDICDDCKKKDKADPKPIIPLIERIKNIVLSKSFLWSLASLVIIAGFTFAGIQIFKGTSFLNSPESETVIDTKNQNTIIKDSDNEVDENTLKRFVEDKNFTEIYNCLENKTDASKYKDLIKDAIKQSFLSVVNTLPSSKESSLDSIGRFCVSNYKLLEVIGFGNEDQTFWEKYVTDYFYVSDLIKKTITNASITQEEKNQGIAILTNVDYVGFFPDDWVSDLENAKLKTAQSVTNPVKNVTHGPVSITYTKADGTPVTENGIVGKIGKPIKSGTYVTISYPKGYIRTKKEKTGKLGRRTIGPVTNEVTIYCDEIEMTFTPSTTSTTFIKE